MHLYQQERKTVNNSQRKKTPSFQVIYKPRARLGVAPAVHQVSSVDVRSVNGYLLKEGMYALKNGAGEIFKLRKTGALWALASEEKLKKKGNKK